MCIVSLWIWKRLCVCVSVSLCRVSLPYPFVYMYRLLLWLYVIGKCFTEYEKNRRKSCELISYVCKCKVYCIYIQGIPYLINRKSSPADSLTWSEGSLVCLWAYTKGQASLSAHIYLIVCLSCHFKSQYLIPWRWIFYPAILK